MPVWALFAPEVAVMGTAREENLVEVSRPHLYRIWKEEDNAEGWPFDASSQETEDSLREHLEGLTYYRYVGSATTRKSFLADVRKGFYFEPCANSVISSPNIPGRRPSLS